MPCHKYFLRHHKERKPYIEGADNMDAMDAKVYEGNVTLRQFIAARLSYYPPWFILLYRARKSPARRTGYPGLKVWLNWVIIFWILSWPFWVHAEAGQPRNSPLVYKLDGTNHCETTSGISLTAMKHQLTNAGIDVLSMHKSFDGREGIAVCGSPKGQINIYEISAPNLKGAQKIGFKRLPESMIHN